MGTSRTQIEIFVPDLFIYATIDIKGKSLPLRLKMKYIDTSNTKKKIKYHEHLPQNLTMYISMNFQEPN